MCKGPPRYLGLELQAPMGTCLGQYGTCSLYITITLIQTRLLSSPTRYRRSSSGDRLSVTPDNLSPSPASSPAQIVTRTSGHVTSLLEVTTNGNGKKDGYHSSTLPLRRPRNRQNADEKNKKVRRQEGREGGGREEGGRGRRGGGRRWRKEGRRGEEGGKREGG